jgi:hypothetical protein
MAFFSVVLAAAGTPQCLSANTSPAMPTSQSAGQTVQAPVNGYQITIQSHPANTGNVFIGGPGLVKATEANVGAILVPGDSLTLGYGAFGISLDSIFADCATSGAVLLISPLG